MPLSVRQIREIASSALMSTFHEAAYHVADHRRCKSPWFVAPLRSLADHDASGGHVLSRHVGLVPDQLRSRLSSEPSRNVVSTFWTREAATASVSFIVAVNLSVVLTWLASPTSVRLVLRSLIPCSSSIGYSIFRARPSAPTRCRRAVLVLRHISSTDFFIRTAYPEV